MYIVRVRVGVRFRVRVTPNVPLRYRLASRAPRASARLILRRAVWLGVTYAHGKGYGWG